MAKMRTVGGVLGVVAGLAAFLWLGMTAFACSALPSVTLSQPYGAAATSVAFTGSGFLGITGPVQVHWDTINGPLLAQTVPSVDGVLAPVTFTVPASAEPGMHIVIATANGSVVERSTFQVVGASGTVGRLPQALLPATSPSESGANVAVIALLAVTGAVGIGLFGAGSAALVLSSRRAVPSRVRHSR